MTTKVYELYPCWGNFSVKTVDYHGTAYLVAATSVRQAYAVAHKDVWIDPDAEHPVGIVSIYRRDTGPTLWCGCSGHRVEGGQPNHGDGVRALRAAIAAHHCEKADQPVGEVGPLLLSHDETTDTMSIHNSTDPASRQS